MKRVLFVSNVRGFLKHLKSIKSETIHFEFSHTSYEVPSKTRKILSKVIRSKVISHLGIIQSIQLKRYEKGQLIASFNRFVNSDTPYVIYLENPTALYHYTLNRNKTFLGRKRFHRNLKNVNLKYIICMSNACEKSMNTLFLPSTYTGNTETIYPLVKGNNHVTINSIEERCSSKELRLLFICQGSRFVSKGGLEIINAMNDLKDLDVRLTIISNKELLPEHVIKTISNNSKITFLEFNLEYSELEKIYSKHHVLLHPTSDESFGMTILEAIKAGLPVISTRLYAIPEMVDDGINGFLTDPKWWFFDKNNLPNPKVWNNRKKTIYSCKTSAELENFLLKKIELYFYNRDILFEHSKASFTKGNTEPFSEEFILEKWESVYDKSFATSN